MEKVTHCYMLHALYSSPNILGILNRDDWNGQGNIAHVKQTRNAYRVLVGKPEGKRPLGMPRCRWKDNIKLDWGRWVVLLGTGWMALRAALKY